jgi:hypothetical protein
VRPAAASKDLFAVCRQGAGVEELRACAAKCFHIDDITVLDGRVWCALHLLCKTPKVTVEHLEVFGARGASFHIKIGIKPQSMEICSGQEIEKMNWALRVKGPQQPLAILCENRALSIDMIDVMVKYGSVFDVDAVEALCANPKVTRELLEAAKRHGALFGFEAAETLCANASVSSELLDTVKEFGAKFSLSSVLSLCGNHKALSLKLVEKLREYQAPFKYEVTVCASGCGNVAAEGRAHCCLLCRRYPGRHGECCDRRPIGTGQRPAEALCANPKVSAQLLGCLAKYGAQMTYAALERLCRNPKVTLELINLLTEYIGLKSDEGMDYETKILCALLDNPNGTVEHFLALRKCGLRLSDHEFIEKLFAEKKSIRGRLLIEAAKEVLAETEGLDPDDAMDHRLEWFNEVLDANHLNSRLGTAEVPPCTVSRTSVLQDFITAGTYMQIRSVAQHLNLAIAGENGSGEGVNREALTLAAAELAGLCTCSSAQDLHPRPGQDVEKFGAAGALVGWAMREGLPFPASFATPMLRALLQDRATTTRLTVRNESLAELESVDPQLHENLCKLRTFDNATLKDVGLSFVFEEDGKAIDLRPPGQRTKQVTAANLEAYIGRRAEHRVRTSVLPQLKAFAAGVAGVVPKEILRCLAPLFSLSELSILVSGNGLDDDSLKAWEERTYYTGFQKGDRTVKDFWKVVHSMSAPDRQQLLRFVTGSPRLPPGGFPDGGPEISRVACLDPPQCPTAATCSATLFLPDYKNFSVLRDRLKTAIANLEFEESVNDGH